MLTLTAIQAAIVAADNKTAKWAFYIYDKNGVGYSFGTSALDQTVVWATGISWDAGITWSTGNLMSSGIMLTNFSGIGLQRNLAENTVIAPSEVTFDISNSGNALDFLDFKGGNVLIELWLSNGTQDIKVGGWRFRIKTAQPGYQNLKITAQDFLQDYLQGDYPNTRLPEDVFPSNRTYSNKALCVPVPFGTAYVPLRDVFITSAGYIMLGSPAYTYAITKVRSPRDRGAKCEWSSASYAFNQSTVADVNGAYWRVFQAIIADVNSDGVAESPGNWLTPGGPVEDPPVQFTRSDTATMTNPADVIAFVLKDMGIPAAFIDEAGTFAAAHTIFDGWGLTFNGAFWYKQDRQTVIASLLSQCHACLQVGEKIELKVLVKVSQKTITGSEVLRTSEQGEGSFSYQDIVNNDLSDSGYVAYQKAGESQDEFVKVLAAANVVSSIISADVLECPFVQNSEDIQRIGTLHLQRKLLKEAEAGFLAKGTCLALQPDDRITLNDDNYGGNYVVLIDSVQINKDLSIQFQCSKYSIGFYDWADVPTSVLTIPTDTVTPTSSWQPVISGPDSIPTSGSSSNILPGRLRVGNTLNYILVDPVTPLRISLFDNDNEKMRMGNLNGFLGYATNIYGLAVGESTKYLKYDPTNGLRIAGAITGSTIDIGGADATSFHVDIDGNLWAGAATFNIATNPFAVSSAGILHATGAVIDGTITAVTGTIGGWTLTATMLKSGATGAARIELDQSAMRISVKDATNASKVVMGYLNALAKHDGTGNWGAGDYGFWAAAGDNLKIDGDVRYKSGDWIVENDGSYLVQNAAAQTIIRLGTDTGEKGLFIYTTAGVKLAKFISDQIFVGEATKYLKYTAAGGLEVAGNITGNGLTMSAAGNIKGGQTAYNTGSGFFLGYSTDAYKFSLGNPAGDFLTWDGTNLTIQGTATFVDSTLPWSDISDDGGRPADNATVGATWGTNITSQPTTLAGINSTEGTKLSGIATGADVTSANTAAGIAGQGALATKGSVDLNSAEVTNKSLANLDSTANTKLGGIATGATVGATWGTDLNSIPATLGAPSGSGLFLSATYMGFYTASAWKTYIDSSGNLVLGDIAGGNAGLSWNQATGVLSIKGAITITSGSIPNASVTGLGALALKASVDLNSAEVTNKSLANLDTTANNKLTGIQAGADVTSSHTAAAIASQGALATKSSVDLATGEVTNKNTNQLTDGANLGGTAVWTGVSGAGKPADNATVGAIWGTNLSSIPATLGAPSGSGLFLSGTYMGYYTASAWKTYIANDGTFAFAGDANNYVTWNGTTLSIKGSITMVSGSVPNASVTGLGALATKSSVDLSSAEVTNKSLANVDGTASTKLAGIAAGADVTSSHTAAGIAGQGALATKGSVDLNSAEVTNKSLANLDGTANTKLGGIQAGAQVNPANLAALDSTAATKLGGIAAGADVTLSAINGGLSITGGGITFSAAGSLKGGQTDYATGTGFFLGYSGAAYKFSIGSSTNYLTWDGSALTIKGVITATSGSFTGTVTATAGTIGGFTLSSTALYAGTGATRIQLDTSAGIHLGATAFADAPFKVSLAGVLTAAGAVITGSYKTSLTVGTTKGIWLNPSDNQMYFYGDRGDGTIENLALIGVSGVGGNNIIGLFGTPVSNHIALYGISNTNTAVVGISNTQYGGFFESAGKAPILLWPSATSSAPTHSADVGALSVTSAGILYINISGNTTWQKVGEQSSETISYAGNDTAGAGYRMMRVPNE